MSANLNTNSSTQSMNAMEHFLSEKFKARVASLMVEHNVPGLAIALVHHKRIESQAFGLACIDPPLPCTSDTLFNIASASKSMTAASVAMLVEDEAHPEVQWEAIMSHILPGDFLMSQDSYTNEVTLDDVVSHRTGLPSHDFSYFGKNAKEADTAQTITRNIRNLPIAAPLRTRFLYSNIMYTASAYMVEQKSGMTFRDWLETKIFTPLDMTSSSLQPTHAKSKGFADRMARGYVWDKTKQQNVGLDMIDAPEGVGAGCIITSVNDYIKWIKAMVHRQGPITEAIYHELLRPRMINGGAGENPTPFTSPSLYCAGLETCHYRGHMRVDHGGGETGFAAKQFFLPEHKFGGVITINCNDENLVGDLLVDELIDNLLGVPDPERPDWAAYYALLKDDEDIEDEASEVRKELLLENAAEPEGLINDPELYSGCYWNLGYRELVVVVKDGTLFVDASDRGFAFTAALEHVFGQHKFLFRMTESHSHGGLPLAVLKAEFRLEGTAVTMLGIHFEPELSDGEMIWFEKRI